VVRHNQADPGGLALRPLRPVTACTVSSASFQQFRHRAVERVVTKIRTAREIHKPERVSVIAHSFGSYILARILASEFDLEWHRVIFCGSVVRDDFPHDTDLNCLDARVMMLVQKILKEKKYYHGPVDGKYNKKVRAALRLKFLKSIGIK
jgi:hypothetical protein